MLVAVITGNNENDARDDAPPPELQPISLADRLELRIVESIYCIQST